MTLRAVSILLLTLLLGGCALRDLGREIEVLEQLGRIEGETRTVDGPGDPTLVVLYALRGLEPVLLNYRVQLQPGRFSLVAPPGRYLVVAFEDLDKDFRHSPGEPLGFAGRDDPLVLDSAADLQGVEIAMTRSARPPGGLSLDLSGRHADSNVPAPRRNVGLLASLDDPRFSSEQGRAASDRPLGAMARGAIGVFFVEPYDPARIPVLYVHGINGSPQDLRPFIEALDRERFQPWFFAYPSTLPLERIATILHDAVLELGVTYDLRRLYVVAHSMGGLVSRSFINKNVALKKRELVRLFITLATPFGGQPSAAVIQSVPGALKPKWLDGVSWVDMVPNSRFLQDLHAEPLAPYVDHHLFWAFLPDSTQPGGGDGVIPLVSQLDVRAEEAATTYPESASHVGILTAPRVHERVARILADAWERDHQALRPDLYVARTAEHLSPESDFDLRILTVEDHFDAEQQERLQRLVELVTARTDSLRALLTSPALVGALARYDADPGSADLRTLLERDQRWRAGEADGVVAEVTDAACNEALRAYTEEEPIFAEIIVSGRTGGNACQSHTTSDYYQADEAWWTRTATERRSWYGELEYDESADAFGVSIYVPLPDDAGASMELAGIVKVLVREP